MKNETRQRKYEQIRENLMFMTRAKDDTLHALIALGKKMGPFRYLMIAVLFVFLFVYHASFHLFVQMKMRERFARAMAAAMSVVLIITSISIPAYAVENISDDGSQTVAQEPVLEEPEITYVNGFESLDEWITMQYVREGGSEEDIYFPDEITASVTAVSQENSEVPEDEENLNNSEDEENLDTPEDEENQGNPEDEENLNNPEDEENLNNPEDEENQGNPEDEENLNNPEDEENLDNPEDEENLNNPEDEENSDNPDDMASGLWKMTTVAVKMPIFYSEPDVAQMSTIIEDMDIAVTWQLKGDIPFNAGTDRIKSDYEYEMVLPDGFELAERVDAPVIRVRIEAPVKSVMPRALIGNYETLTIKSDSLNHDSVRTSTDKSSTLDGHAGFYDSTYRNDSGALPSNRRITMSSGVPYDLPAYTGKDCIRVSSSLESATMTLNSLSAYDRVYVLATAGGVGTSTSAPFSVMLTYTDGTTTSGEFTLQDWFNTSTATGIEKYAKVMRDGDDNDGSTTAGPYLQSVYVKANSGKVLKEITFKYTGTESGVYCGVYAVTGKFADGVPTQAVSTPTAVDTISNAFTLNWSKVSNATGYYIDVATDSSFTKMVDGYNNMKLGSTDYTEKDGTIVYTVGGEGTAIANETTYYFRVRPYNSSGPGPSSSTGNATTKYITLESPVLTYSVPSDFEQTVKWPHVKNAGKYTWTLSRNGEELVSEQEILVTQEIEESGVALNISDYLDDRGTYSLSVKASPADEHKYRYVESTSEWTMDFGFPQIESKTTCMPDGSGIGGSVTYEMENGRVTLTPVPDNSYSDFYRWETDNTNLAEDSQTNEYVLNAADSYYDVTAYFGVYVEKIDVSYDGTTYMLTLKDDIKLEDALVFAEDENVVIDLNGKTMATTTENKIVAQESVLTIKNGNISSGSVAAPALLTEGDGAIIIEKSAAMMGTVDGDAQVTWTEKDGSVHYATLADALENNDKKAEEGSDLTLIQDVVLGENVTIPQDIEIKIPQGVGLTVSEGYTLINNGTLNTNGTLSNKGAVVNTTDAEWRNSGLVDNDGKITNNGGMDNNAGNIDNAGTIEGDGEIVNENGYVDTTGGSVYNSIDNGYKGKVKSEVTWDENGETYFGSLKGAAENASIKPQQQITITLQDNVTMNENITVPDNAVLFIPSDTTLTVPEDITLDNDGNIVEAGKLDVEGTLDTQAEWTEGSTTHYGTLQEALDEVKDGESITLMQDTDLTEELEDGESFIAPENAALVVPADVTLVLPKDVQVENEENIISDTVWADEEDKNYGSLESAVQDAAVKPEEDISIVLRDDVELDNDLTIPGNAHLQIPEGASLLIPNGTTLDNNGNIEADGDLVVDDGGILDTEANWNEEGTEYYGTFNEALEALQDPEKDVDEIVIVGDVTLGEDVTIPENNSLIIKDNASLTVPEDAILDNKGTISNEGILNNKGTIQNDNSIDNKGIVEGDGTIANQNGNIDTDNGILQNKIQNETGDEDGSNVKSEASWTGVDENGETVTYYGSLSKALETAGVGAEVTLYQDVVLDENTTIPEGLELKIPDGKELIVPEGITLTNNGIITNDGTISNNSGTITNKGEVTGEGTFNNNGTGLMDTTAGVFGVTVNNAPTAKLKAEVSWEADGKTCFGSLEEAIKAAENTSEDVTIIVNSNPLALEGNVTIPENMTLVIPDGNSLEISRNATLINNGMIANDGEIEIGADAAMTNNGDFTNGGKIINKGAIGGTEGIQNEAGGIVDNISGMIQTPVENNGGEINTEASWKDESGNIQYGTLQEAIESGRSPITINGTPIELKDDLTIPEGMELIIPDNKELVIPEGKTLTNKGIITAQGNISTQGTGKLETETAWKDDNGVHYGDLQDAIEAANKSDSTVKEIIVKDDVTLADESKELSIPNGVDFVVEEDASLTIPADGKLIVPEGSGFTNKGTVTNKGMVENNGELKNSGTVDGEGSIINDGSIVIDGGVIRNDITNTDEAQTPETSATVKWITSEDGVEKTYYGDLETVLKNAKAGDTITLLQDESLSIDTNIPVGVTVVIPEGKELVVPTNSTLTNSGAIDNKGILSNDGGSIVNNENGIIQNNGGTFANTNQGQIYNSGVIESTNPIHNNGNGTIDTTQGVLSGEVWNADATGTFKAEVFWEVDGKTYYGSLEEAIDAAAGTEETIISLMGNPVIIDGNVTIPDNVTLEIPGDTVLEVKGTLYNGGKIEVATGGKVKNKGTLVNDEQAIIINKGEMDNIANATLTNNGNLENEGTLTSNGDIEGNGEITNSGFVNLESGSNSNIIVNENPLFGPKGEVSSEASWEIEGKTYYGSLQEGIDAVKTNGGTVTLNRDCVILCNDLSIPNGVELNVPDDSLLIIPDEVVFTNNGEIKAEGEVAGKVNSQVCWTDNKGITHFGMLDKLLEELESGGRNVESVTIIGEVTLPENKEIIVPSHITVTVDENAELIVPDGTTFVNKGTVVNEGRVTNNGTISNEGSFNNEGVLENQAVENAGNGTSTGAVKRVTEDGKVYYSDLETALETAETGDIIVLDEDVEITEDMTIPSGVTLEVPEDRTLIVAPGVVLGNEGTVKNNGTIQNSGIVDNIGSGTISGNNSIENSDTGIISSDVTWEITDTDGNTQLYYGSLEDGLDALKNMDGGTLTLNRDIVCIEDDVTIPSNVTLVVPENTELNVAAGKNLTNNGSIENNGIIQNNGDIIGMGNISNENGIIKSESGNIATNIKNGESGAVITEATWTINGKTYYGTLEDALLAAKSQLNSSITINNDLSINSDVVIPGGVNISIASGVKVTIEPDASLTNNGTLTNNGEIECEGSFANGSRVDGNGSISGETTWTDGSKICYGSLETAIEEAKEGDTITVLKNIAITDSVTLPHNVTLEVPANVTVTLKPGVEITGSVIGDGNVVEEKLPEPKPPVSDDDDNDDDDNSSGSVVLPEELLPEETTEELPQEGLDSVLGEATEDEEVSSEEAEAEEESAEETSSDAETATDEVVEESGEEEAIVNEEPDIVVIETPQEAEGVEIKKNTNVSMGQGEVIITAVSEAGRLSGELGNILSACFTEEELNAIRDGENTEIRLTVVSLKKETNLTKKDRKAIEKAVSEYGGSVDGLELGTLYEVVIERKIGDGNWEKLSELHEDIDVTIEIPEEIRKDGRTYFAIRNHEGECTILKDKDNAPYTITISTGLFSTYAITFTDAAVAADVDVEILPPVSSAIPVWPWMLVIAVLAMGAITFIVWKKRSEETGEV